MSVMSILQVIKCLLDGRAHVKTYLYLPAAAAAAAPPGPVAAAAAAALLSPAISGLIRQLCLACATDVAKLVGHACSYETCTHAA